MRLGDSVLRRETALTVAQLFALRVIATSPSPLSLRDVAEHTHTDMSSVSVVVSRLVAFRLVTRQRDERDRRRISLTITPRGLAELRRAPRTPDEEILQAINALSDSQVRQLADALGAIARSLEGWPLATRLPSEPAAVPKAADHLPS